MACFLLWMASFFIMASFWKYIEFAWSTRKDRDFLQVQKEHCRRLCNVIPSLEKSLKYMEASSKTEVLNKSQCKHLFGKLILAMKGINKMLSNATEDLKFQSIFEELYCLQKKVEIVGKSCIEQDQWCHLVVFQFQNKETFCELLLDLKCCYDTACDMYLSCQPNQSNHVLPIQFDAANYEQVLEDGQELKRKLEHVPQEDVSEDYKIARHLLLRLRNLDRVDGGDLDALNIANDFKKPEFIKNIGKGGYGDVYKSNWLGLECATKVLKGKVDFLMNSRKEPGILAGLSHPNLVQFFGFGIIKIIDENLKEDETHEMHLVMELMESNLSSMLKNSREPLPYHLAIDIMHQIAKGVYYLHDMQVAHLDLKLDNVLYNSIPMEDLDPHCIFKVMDYGTSELEVCSNPENPETTQYTIGTPRYRSPEMIKGSQTPLHLFRADVWSFAMICSEILSGKVPYYGLEPKDFRDQISRAHGSSHKILRPNLPNNCEELTNLIQECWCQDPLQRPTFSEICERLTSLKKSFLKGIYSYKMVPQFGSSRTYRDYKSIMNHVPKVDEQIAPPKEIPIDVEHQLSKAKGLLKMNYIGIVGMGGIGKTTLAKAILDDTTMKSMYNASCFIAECKNYQSSYNILCEILPKLGNDRKSKNLGDGQNMMKVLPKLGNDRKPKNLGDAQNMMKELLVDKKVLLILDDVNDVAQVHDIVPPDIVQASKGTTIIITTRKWNTIKSFVGIDGKLDVEFLDEMAATTLFTTHLSWGVSLLPPNFEDLRKHVVKACNGLPLSLKVMGAFLHNKKRLRSWERALQRMARGKNLDGDEHIWNTLQISYDGLSNDVEKGIFLDVACFFCRDVYPFGISKETILSIWFKDGKFPVRELERLIDMSLLKVNDDGSILEMHDQLRDMGCMIAKTTRIWRASMIPESGFTSKDITLLEGISWHGTMVRQDFEVIEGIFGQKTTFKHDQSFDFEKLRILILVTTLDICKAHVDNLDLLLRLAFQCSKLEVIIIRFSIYWVGLPHTLQEHTAVTLYKRISDLCSTCTSLKILDLAGFGVLKQLPNTIASCHNLLRLILSSCSSLTALPNELGNLTSLTTLDLRWCSSLAALPNELGNLSSLTTLVLSGCTSLMALPNELGNLSSLTTLNLSDCIGLTALPNEVENLSSLTTLDLEWCSSLAALPNEVGNLSSLTILSLRLCSSLAALPNELGNLSSLTTLDLGWCSSLAALPTKVGNLSSLTYFYLVGCTTLVALPNEVGNLSSLTTLDLDGCSSLAALPNEVGNLSSLITLILSWCTTLVALPNELGNLSSLTTLNLGGCSSLVTLPNEVGNLLFLTTLDLYGCSSLTALPNELGNLSSLTTLNLRLCSSLVALPNELGDLSSLSTLRILRLYPSLVALPTEVENLSSLTTLELYKCSNLATLPKEVGNLSSLTTLDLSECSSLVTLPNELGNLSSLSTLNLRLCLSLVALPNELGNLSSLTTLSLRLCSSLVALPNELGNLSSLTTLDLGGCSRLVTLPNEVGNLSFLTTLDLYGCSSLAALPNEVGNLSSLTNLFLVECASLVALPNEVENLSSLTTLNFGGCTISEELPNEVGNLASLTSLHLVGCSSLAALPNEVGNLSSLTSLYLVGCSSLVALPNELGNLSSLTCLYLIGCSSLAALPNEVGNLSSLTTLDLHGCSSLAALPNEVGNLSALTILDLRRCSSLTALPNEMGNLSSLTNFYLVGCASLVALPNQVGNLSSLTTFCLVGCSSLVALSNEIGNLSSLATLDLRRCSSLAALPNEVGSLSSLTTLQLDGCANLETLPNEVGSLSSLTTLDLSGCTSLAILPNEVGNLSSLTTLDLSGCLSLTALPKDVGNLSSLTTLYLGGCTNLATLPNEVGNLSSLISLYLVGCSSLAALPKDVGSLSSLTTLHLGLCTSLVALPSEVGNLSSLTTLDLHGCSNLATLPNEVKILSTLTVLNFKVANPLDGSSKES